MSRYKQYYEIDENDIGHDYGKDYYIETCGLCQNYGRQSCIGHADDVQHKDKKGLYYWRTKEKL